MDKVRPYNEPTRIGKYKINHNWENVLFNVNNNLQEIERKLISEIPKSDNKIIIFCYPPRSGSTFLSQLLAQTGEFNYISNFIARFWKSPYFAGLLEKKLSMRNFNFVSTQNDYGVTNSFMEPHEFGFFINLFFPKLSDSDLIKLNDITDSKRTYFNNEIQALLSLYDKPLFLKHGLLGLNVELLHHIFKDQVKFIVIKRNPIFIAQSIYKARQDIYGKTETYLSTRPSNYQQIKDMPVVEQISNQIKGIYNDIYEGINKSKVDFIEISYEELCRNPVHEINKIMKFSLIKNAEIKNIKSTYKISDKIFIDKEIFSQFNLIVNNIFDKTWFNL